MLISAARVPPEHMHSVNPSHVLSGLSLVPIVKTGSPCAAGRLAGCCAACCGSKKAGPPRKAFRRKDEDGRSKKITAAPSMKESEATPKRVMQPRRNRYRTRGEAAG